MQTAQNPLSKASEDTDSPLGSDALNQIEHVRSLLGETLQPSPPKKEADDECLEDYMGRFMERLTGKKAEPADAAGAASAAPSSQPVATAQPAPPAQLREPSRPPECVNKMALLRELANQCARSAIAEHDHDNAIQKIRYLLVASVGSSLLSSCLAGIYMLTGVRYSLELAAIFGLTGWCLAGGFCLWLRQLPRRESVTSATAS